MTGGPAGTTGYRSCAACMLAPHDRWSLSDR
jgi:hypothetical protein